MTKKKFEAGRGYAKEDWDAVESPELSDAELAQAKPFAEAFPDLAGKIARTRGRPRLESPKEAVTLRLDAQTIAKFQATGEDWRTRMSDVLRRAKIKS